MNYTICPLSVRIMCFAVSLYIARATPHFFRPRLPAATIFFGCTAPAPPMPNPTFGLQTLHHHFPVGGFARPTQPKWNHSSGHSSF